jgi:phenylalanyl-tRNA synthetase beta chain
MRAPLSWIREFVDIASSVSAEEISDALIRVGFEVEEIIKQGTDLKGPLIFAKVLSIEELTEFKKPGKDLREILLGPIANKTWLGR